MEVGLVDRQQEALDQIRVRIVHLRFGRDAARFEFGLLKCLHAPVDPCGYMRARDHEDHAGFRIRLEVLKTLEQPVAADIGNEQRADVKHLHEAGQPTAWRGIAVASGVAGCDHGERRVLNERLHVRFQEILHLCRRDRVGAAKLPTHRVDPAHGHVSAEGIEKPWRAPHRPRTRVAADSPSFRTRALLIRYCSRRATQRMTCPSHPTRSRDNSRWCGLVCPCAARR